LRSHLLGSNHNFPAWPALEHVRKSLIKPTDTQIVSESINHDRILNDTISREFTSNNSLSAITPTKFQFFIRKQNDIFVAKLYYTLSIPRKHIQSIIEDSSTFLMSSHISV